LPIASRSSPNIGYAGVLEIVALKKTVLVLLLGTLVLALSVFVAIREHDIADDAMRSSEHNRQPRSMAREMSLGGNPGLQTFAAGEWKEALAVVRRDAHFRTGELPQAEDLSAVLGDGEILCFYLPTAEHVRPWTPMYSRESDWPAGMTIDLLASIHEAQGDFNFFVQEVDPPDSGMILIGRKGDDYCIARVSLGMDYAARIEGTPTKAISEFLAQCENLRLLYWARHGDQYEAR
jgi:hypothetical protein